MRHYILASELQLKMEADDYPDLSFYGEFSNTPETDHAIRHKGGRDSLPYFNPANAGDSDYDPKYGEQDYARMLDYERGSWYMLGLYAAVDVKVPGFADVWHEKALRWLRLLPAVDKHWHYQEFRTPGLWGIESDSGDAYFLEVWCEEVWALRAKLARYGIGIKNDRPTHLTVKEPYGGQVVIPLDDDAQKRLNDAIKGVSTLRRVWRYNEGRVSRFFNSLVARRDADVAGFVA